MHTSDTVLIGTCKRNLLGCRAGGSYTTITLMDRDWSRQPDPRKSGERGLGTPRNFYATLEFDLARGYARVRVFRNSSVS